MFTVQGIQDPKRFLDLQRAFYRGDPNYVPPLTSADAWAVDPRQNDWFETGEATFLVARAGDEVVGRISAARDHKHDQFHDDRVGFFGHFEARNESAAHALLAAAKEWVLDRGATSLRGPVDLSTNYRCGLLVDDRDPGPPRYGMNYNPPVYADWIESFGLDKVKDLLALELYGPELDQGRQQRIVDKLRQRTGISTRPMNKRRMRSEIETMWSLYNAIWETNWGYVPMSRGEFLHSAKDLKKVMPADLVTFAMRGDQPIGFSANLPDLNRAIRACNGRLLPLGWWRFLRTLRRTRFTRMITLGVVPECRKTGADTILLFDAIQRSMAIGYDHCEASWILEDNHGMLRPLLAMGGEHIRTYRLYGQPLDPPA